MPRPSTALLALVTFLLALAACGSDSTEPPDPPGPQDPGGPDAVRIAIGDTVEVALSVESPIATLSIRSESGVELAVFHQALAGEVSLTLLDSVTRDPIDEQFVPTDSDRTHLGLRRLFAGAIEGGQVLLLRAERAGSGPARVRLVAYPIDRTPELVPASITLGDTLNGETFENLADIDEFSFEAAEGDELIAYLQGLGGAVPSGAFVRLHTADRVTQLAQAVNGAGDSELDAQPTGRFLIPGDGTYLVSVGHSARSATAQQPGTGGYRILVRRVNRAPEVAAAMLAPGDTLSTEAIDFVGDIDEFQVPVSAGGTYNVFLHKLGSFTAPTLRVTVVAQAGIAELSRTSSAADSVLAGQFTGSFSVPATGHLTLRVEGLTAGAGLHRGPYRLFVYAVNRGPELVPDLIPAGTSIVETIELPGDVDEFNVSPPATGITNLQLGRITRGGTLDLTWPGPTGEATSSCLGAEGPTEPACSSGHIRKTSAFRAMVESEHSFTSGFRGSYRLSALAIDTMPEGQPQTIVVGSTITESASPAGDLDVYRLVYAAADPLELRTTLPAGASGGDIVVSFRAPDGETLTWLRGGFPPRTGRFTLPVSGVYQVEVASTGFAPGGTGAYTLQFLPFPTLPEGGPPIIAAGDSLTSETIGALGDIDDFVYSAAPGSEVQGYVRGQTVLRVDAVEAGSNTILRSGKQFTTGRMVVPAGGQVRMRVYEPRRTSLSMNEADVFSYIGPYQLVARRIDRLPESVGPALVLGVPVQAESIDPVGDVDEFVLAGTAGQPITALINIMTAWEGPQALVEVIDPLNGQVLGTATSNGGISGPIVLPATRSYTIRVRGDSDYEGGGPYRLLVQ